jgi:hypothetical protein
METGTGAGTECPYQSLNRLAADFDSFEAKSWTIRTTWP